MEKVTLKAHVRTETGKKVAKDLRQKGIIPANEITPAAAARTETGSIVPSARSKNELYQLIGSKYTHHGLVAGRSAPTFSTNEGSRE